jgi:hypothetical protein
MSENPNPRLAPLHGLMFKMDRKADRKNPCHENLAVVKIGQGPNSAGLYCKACRKHRAWMPKKMTEWFLTVLKIFPVAIYDIHTWQDETQKSYLDLRRERAKKPKL